ncbi:TenA family protein [Cognatishimia sp.]|uniref:TenA family protein n=1 Tax=Cognatishimia sp. TaxID=2211648 RepID=UPI00351863A3
MRATEFLQSQTQADWSAATTHAFTNALVDGSLDADKMIGYLQQDYLFIEDFVRLLASAIAHAPSLADAVPAAQFLGVITGPENTYFLRSFEALEAKTDAPAAQETTAFLNLMRKARASGRYEIMLSVLVVAEWVYLDWAQPFEDRAEGLPFWFGEWITLHCGPGFEGVVSYLRGQLDQCWEGLSDAAKQDVVDTFTAAVACERDFFDAAWAGFEVAT